MGLTAVNTNYKERLGIVMKLKVGDIVEFKNYEDMTDDERSGIDKRCFPCRGTVSNVYDLIGRINIQEFPYSLREGSVARVISDVDDVDINSLNEGDEVLVKVTVKKAFSNYLQINSSIDDSDVVKVLKRIKPDRFIIQEKCYGFYIGVSGDLVSNKDRAQVYADHDAAYQEATDMNINLYDVIPYDD